MYADSLSGMVASGGWGKLVGGGDACTKDDRCKRALPGVRSKLDAMNDHAMSSHAAGRTPWATGCWPVLCGVRGGHDAMKRDVCCMSDERGA